jgi:hypothetical protein
MTVAAIVFHTLPLIRSAPQPLSQLPPQLLTPQQQQMLPQQTQLISHDLMIHFPQPQLTTQTRQLPQGAAVQ